MNKQKIFCTLLSLTLLAGTVTIPASADETDTVTVFVTANNQGTLSQTSDGSILFNLPVEVTDLNQDGSFSADEALQAAHKTYLSSADYETSSSEYGLSVHKLWGISTFNTLFFLNDKALSVDVGTATVSEGDRLTASVNQDNTYFADWYTYFIPHEKTVAPDEAFTLSLQGFCGMAYPPEDAVPVAGISVGTWENGSFHAMEDAVTDDNGSVTLSFAEAGTYYITASGTVTDEVMDYSSFQYVTADCPIIAPGCFVTVTTDFSADDTPEQEENALAQLTGLLLEATSSEDAEKNETESDEEVLIPAFSPSHKTYNYTVNYFCDLLTVTPTANGVITIHSQQVESGESIQIPLQVGENVIDISVVKDENTAQYQLYVYRKEASQIAEPSTPDKISSYLPAPGQFVNLDSYQKPEKTLRASGLVTLGAFGGNIVYQYDTPIENSPNNPYGIDFIVMGNCFTNTDESTASAAAEPAAVMVSADGESWYELAGSQYYEASTRHNVTLTYTNNDTTFSAASDIPWADSEGESGILPKNDLHTQAYYPNPAYYNAYQTGAGKNTTYTKETVSFTGTMIASGFYPFGYADSHAEVPSMGNQAANPYIEHHEMNYNGDGFDLAWAVDENGNPVSLEEISYIRIYNPVLAYGDSTGEKSAEIKTVLRALPAQNAVGTSKGLSGLSVNSTEIKLSDGVYTYDIDADGASSLIITPTTANPDANIYVSNQRVAPGSSTEPISAVGRLRIIVQEGEKEPVIYRLNLTNPETPENNADLVGLDLTPGDVLMVPNDEHTLSCTVASSVTAIRLTPEVANPNAKIVLAGGNLRNELELTNKTTGELLELDTGKNTFTLSVTSENGENTKNYTVIITRQKNTSGGASSKNTISVKFSLTGDKIHYNSQSDKMTGKHSNPVWISSKTVDIPKGQTVKYLTEMMLNNAGLDYTTNGIYISTIKELSEFDNGPNSGWMFRVNGKISEEGYESYILSDEDVVKWFYSDDYTKEKDYEGGWDDVNHSSGSSSSSGGSSAPARTNITPSVTPTTPTVPTKTFTDTENHWASEAISYVYKKTIMQGISETEFAPDMPMTRAMLLTVLYRLENPKTVTYENPFTDVPAGTWYTDAICWASANQITSGISATQFAPDETITREQLAVMMYRYAEQKTTTTARTALSAFSDLDKISPWATDAMQWANAVGLMSGTTNTTLAPKDTATRAQVAAILMRFCKLVTK